jgi:catechol 2,3-dioxygenase-like lactoylglutathione lyase family enzyme
MGAPELRGLDHVVLRVAELERSLRFYCDALGCRVERRLDALGLVQLRAGAALIDLVPVDSPLGRAGGSAPGAAGRNLDHFALQVARFDAEALRAHLAARGVEAGEVAERYGALGMGPSLYLRDPDGNVVELKGVTEPCDPAR